MSISILPIVAIVAQLAVKAPPISILLYNPTGWEGSSVVEIPVGRIATPGIVDWTNTHLDCGGRSLPFALREGRAHWKATLSAPGAHPRAEDLLVFSCSVAPGSWARIDVTQGAVPSASALEKQDGQFVISYPDYRVAVAEETGALLSFDAFGKPLLAKRFAAIPVRLSQNGYEMVGPIGAGYEKASVNIQDTGPTPFRARCVSQSSTAAMTQLDFALEPESGPAMGLTYRLHVSGMLEISVDERPWQQASPWLDHAVKYTLQLAGTPEHLPLLESRWPFYGFRDYTAAVKGTACLHRGTEVGILELGDETVNGRQYIRRLFAIAGNKQVAAADLAELADDGPVVTVLPARTFKLGEAVALSYPEALSPVADELRHVLKDAGVETVPQGAAPPIHLAQVAVPEMRPDGFAIVPDPAGGVTLRSETALGLYSAVRAIARHLRKEGREAGLPLVAGNPIVDLRAGGFGGGDFEVDFPYGSDEEWTNAFNGLLDSGMNVFACLGMWGNWKMPVGYKYMPELRSDAPDAYDESSGAKFAELDTHREHGLKLMRYLHERGARVWLWIPIGCVPTTFAKHFPDAMTPGNDKIPCFTHPEYRRYVDAFFRELLETYSLDGFVLIRDDNGGVCTCDRCKQYVAESRTKSAVWEQYLVTYDWLRRNGFKGDVAVYPYNDPYQPKLDPLLPSDLWVIGHGGGAAVLTRGYERIGPMGDTWLDNLYANFRVPPTSRMRRLLGDRGSFWIGGAYCGTELPWESVGRFGWEPTATPNSLRYEWGLRTFGRDGALAFLRMNNTYEHLWDINALYMPPADWMKLPKERRKGIVKEGGDAAEQLRKQLWELEKLSGSAALGRWFGHVGLFAPYFEYHLHRLDLFADIYERVVANRDSLGRPEGLPKDVRETILSEYAEMYAWAAKYDAVMQKAPDGMLAHCRWMTKPYKEWMAGYDQWLDPRLDIRQFAGMAKIESGQLRCGQAFTLNVELHNSGVCPWVAGAGHRVEISGIAGKLGLPAIWEFEGEPVAPGDRRVVAFKGTAPQTPGEGEVSIAFLAPYRSPEKFIQASVKLAWN